MAVMEPAMQRRTSPQLAIATLCHSVAEPKGIVLESNYQSDRLLRSGWEARLCAHGICLIALWTVMAEYARTHSSVGEYARTTVTCLRQTLHSAKEARSQGEATHAGCTSHNN